MTGINEEVENVAVLEFQGSDDGHQALDEATAGCALGTKTRLAPKNGRANLAFSKIVGRLDTLVIKEGPKGLFAFENISAGASGFGVTTVSAQAQQLAHLGLTGLNIVLERSARNSASPKLVPSVKDEVELFQELFADLGRGAIAFSKGLEISFEMCPAELA